MALVVGASIAGTGAARATTPQQTVVAVSSQPGATAAIAARPFDWWW
jgi:hypothetical protein